MLQINNLCLSFSSQNYPILNGISLTLQKGDFCVIIGSNGSGKSTFLKTLLGEYTPDSGEIWLNHKNITRQPLYQRAKNMSCVFQDVLQGTISDMTVAENLSLAQTRAHHASLKSYHRHQALWIQRLSYLQMGLEKYLHTLCSALSGGQRQAIAFTMATLDSPHLLLLDEHCSALDPKNSHAIMENTANLITQLNITTLMVTHNLRDALMYGNRLIMIHQGKIVFDVTGAAKKTLTMDYLLQLFHQHEDRLLIGE